MRQQIIDLYNINPRTYIRAIKKDAELTQWVLDNAVGTSESFPALVYSAVHNEPLQCKHNNTRKFDRWSSGLTGCGPAGKCKCTAEQIAISVLRTKQLVSEEAKQASNKKRKNTMLDKYGVEYNLQRADVNEKLARPKVPAHVYSMLTDYNWMHTEYVANGRSAVDIASELNVYYSTVIEYCKAHNFKIRSNSNYSLIEVEVEQYLSSLGVKIIKHCRDFLQGNNELDLYLPDYNIAIEINGLYWHSSPTLCAKHKQKHICKTEQAEHSGIRLIHITDYEWINKQSVIKSMLCSMLGINSNRIYARNTTIKSISTGEAREFLNANHLQGNCSSKYKYGLFYADKLVFVLTAGKSRFGSAELEIHRIASLQHTTVVGGASKLLSFLIHQTGATSIISYCDRDKSAGNIYNTLGFSFVKYTGPGYFWTDGNNIISRYKSQKNKLKSWLPLFDDNLSETQNMFANNYRIYWTTGNTLYRLQCR